MEMCVEYKPLTDEQWKQQTAEERRKWEAVDAAREDGRGAARRKATPRSYSPEWIELMLEAGRRSSCGPRSGGRRAVRARPDARRRAI